MAKRNYAKKGSNDFLKGLFMFVGIAVGLYLVFISVMNIIPVDDSSTQVMLDLNKHAVDAFKFISDYGFVLVLLVLGAFALYLFTRKKRY